jgi:dihydropteroate synthase
MYSLSDQLIRKGVLVMGILNVTPDSFSDGGELSTPEAALLRASQMVDAGADILDIGGESTRPPGKAYGSGAQPVSAEEELDRVIPVVAAVRKAHPDVLLSIDTTKAAVAREAVKQGANIINDVSAATQDPAMFLAARDTSSPLILMHGYGPFFSRPSIEDYAYESVTRTVLNYLRLRMLEARNFGVKEVLGDVGIGFAKTYKDNLRLLRDHHEFKSLGVPMVLGVSRKSTIGIALGNTSAPKDRVVGSLAAACYCLGRGAKIIRTHDVQPTVEALKVWQAIDTID